MSGPNNTRSLRKNLANAQRLYNITGLNNDKKRIANLTKRLNNSRMKNNTARKIRNEKTRASAVGNVTLKNVKKGSKWSSNYKKNLSNLRNFMKDHPINGTQLYENKKIKDLEEHTKKIQEETKRLEIENEKARKELAILEEEQRQRQIKWDQMFAKLLPLGPQMSNEEAFGIGAPNPKSRPTVDPTSEQYIRNHYD